MLADDKERREDIAEQLDSKADEIEAGNYGGDPDNDAWIADLRHAARSLRQNDLSNLNASQIEEIENGSDADEDEISELEEKTEE